MRTSEDIAELAAALVAAQGHLNNAAKDSKNPHFRSAFASLESVRAATQGPLAEQGLCIVQGLSTSDNGAVICTTRLLHKSGQWIEDSLAMRPTKNDPQGMGSAATYARRYSLMALVGIAPTDDDGNAASRPVPTRSPRGGKVAKWSDTQRAAFFASLSEAGVSLEYDVLAAWCEQKGQPRPSDLPTDRRDKLARWLIDGGAVEVHEWAGRGE